RSCSWGSSTSSSTSVCSTCSSRGSTCPPPAGRPTRTTREKRWRHVPRPTGTRTRVPEIPRRAGPTPPTDALKGARRGRADQRISHQQGRSLDSSQPYHQWTCVMLRKKVAEGIHCVQDGYVNWFIVERSERSTIVDAGLSVSWKSLQKSLIQLGRHPEDIKA